MQKEKPRKIAALIRFASEEAWFQWSRWENESLKKSVIISLLQLDKNTSRTKTALHFFSTNCLFD